MMQMLEFPIDIHTYIHTYLIIYSGTAAQKKNNNLKKNLHNLEKSAITLFVNGASPLAI